MALLLLFAIGAAFGSFLNVLIDRLSTGRTFLKGRSYCENCHKTLTALDLIPLVSFIYLKGRCRHCGKKIPKRLFVVEIICALTLPLLYFTTLQTGFNFFAFLALSVVIFSFIGIFFADLEYGIIPDFLVITSLFGSLVYLTSFNAPLLPHFITGIVSFLFFFLLHVITKGRGMGFGDVKLAFVLGFLLGYPQIIVALYLAFLTGAFISIILIIWRKIRFFGSTIPFGPFLIVSSIVALFYGDKLLSTFFHFFPVVI